MDNHNDSDNDNDNERYKTGYGKPPLESRWQKGKSGNPKGRPRKPKPSTYPDLIDRVLAERLPRRRKMVAKNMSVAEALVRKLVKEMAEGDPNALKALDRLRKWVRICPAEAQDAEGEIVEFTLALGTEESRRRVAAAVAAEHDAKRGLSHS